MTLPEPVTPIRFWAALWLFILGTVASLSCGHRLRGRDCRSFRCSLGRGSGSCARTVGFTRAVGFRAVGFRAVGLCHRHRWIRRRYGRCRLRRLRSPAVDRGRIGGDLVDRVFAVRRVVALRLVHRCHRDVHRLAFEQRRALRDPVILDPVHEPRDQVPPDLRMGQLASSEADGHLDPVTILEELDRPMDLRVEVADADLRREANLLARHRALLALGFLLPLRELVLVLPEVEEPDDRRGGHRSDLDEVVASILRHLEGLGRGHDTQLCTLFIDHPDLWDPDHLVDTQVSTDGSPLDLLDPSTGIGNMRTPLRPSREDSTEIRNPTMTSDRPVQVPRRQRSRPSRTANATYATPPRGPRLRPRDDRRMRPTAQPAVAPRRASEATRSVPRSRDPRARRRTGPSVPGPPGSCTASGSTSRRRRPEGRASEGARPAPPRRRGGDPR